MRENLNKMVVACVFGVPQHVNAESEQIWAKKSQKITRRLGVGILLQHKDNTVNTRIPDTVADVFYIYIYVFLFLFFWVGMHRRCHLLP